MSRHIILTLILAVAGCALPMRGANASDITCYYKFGSSSPLATGKWVRISVSGSGIFQITDAELAAMGFSNPSKVAIYGPGGERRSMDFLDKYGNRLIEDNLQPVHATYADGRLIFYSAGDRSLNFTTRTYSSVEYPMFKRTNLNTYSEQAYYLLTDSHPGYKVYVQPVPFKDNVTDLTEAHAFLYHEDEIYNGLQEILTDVGSGDLWWGDHVYAWQPLTFDINAPYYTPGGHVCVYTDIVIFSGFDGNYFIDLNGSSTQSTLTRGSSSIYTIANHSVTNTLNEGPNHTGLGTLSLKSTGNYTYSAPLGLDYWSLVYPTNFDYMAEDPDFSQLEVGLNLARASKWRLPVPDGLKVWDITDPVAAEEFEVTDGYLYSSRSDMRKAVIFDPTKQMRSINPGFKAVANQDLHALQNEPWDMIIYTMPAFLQHAEKIAALHEEHYGEKVAVVTPQQLFDEFNGGTPDAMAYRLFAKMLYQHASKRLKNVLFLGPVHGDYRNIKNVADRMPGHIGYQDNIDSNLMSISALAMDYYGIMADYMRIAKRIDSAPVSIGVGLLPIETQADGDLVVNKIRRYMEQTDRSGTVNETYAISCPGDNHIHENQSIGMQLDIQDYAERLTGSKFAHETLWMEASSVPDNRVRIQDALRRGKGLFVYHGHSTPTGFQGFNMDNAMNAGNKELGMAIFAGCDLTHVDKGLHGIGDLPVFRSENGFIAAIGSTRTVISGENREFTKSLTDSYFKDAADKVRTTTPTIGEIFAQAKDRTTNVSSIAYILVGDPGLRVPLALTPVQASITDRAYRAGETVTVQGSVTDSYGNVMSGYNGYVTVKLMEPTRMIVTPVGSGEKMLDYEVNDLPLLAVKGTVTNGTFTVKLTLPEETDAFMSGAGDDETVSLPLYIGTWSEQSNLGGAGSCSVAMAVCGSDPDEDAEHDTQAPTAVLSHNSTTALLTVTVSDDVAIMPGIGGSAGTQLSIDGTPYYVAYDGSSDMVLPDYSATIDVARLAPGHHQALLTVTDLSGNSITQTLSFTAGTPAPLTLSAASPVAVDQVDFSLAGGYGGEYELIVTDRHGNVAARETVSGTAFSLTGTDELPAGVYRAAVRKNSHQGAFVYSNHVEFTVID